MIKIHQDNTHFTLTGIKNCPYLNKIFISIKEINLFPFTFIDNNNLHFHAQTVEFLDDYKNNETFLKYDEILFVLYSISSQIYNLEQMGFTFFGFDIKDILVINKKYFFIINPSKLVSINNKNLITFLKPFQKPYFSSPEMLNLNELPMSLNFKSIYYSLGSLLVYCMFQEYILKGNDFKNMDEIEKILVPIYKTKLYWCLKRCLEIKIENRFLLFI